MNRHLRTFYLLTLTQVLSLIGSGMTHVAVGIWLFERYGQSTPLLLSSFFSALPLMVGGLLAGALADRWNRRQTLLASDAGQAVGTLLLMLSFASGRFAPWHLYALSFLQGTLAMVQRPAMEASVTMLVPEAHRDRANAIRQMTGPAAGMIAPVITGLAYVLIGVSGVMVIDLLTFAVAVIALYRVEIPQPQRSALSSAVQADPSSPPQPDAQTSAGTERGLWAEMRAGLAFLWQRRTLLFLMVNAAALNFVLSSAISLNTPYLLTLTGREETLGLLLGALNLGIVVGGVAMMIWGGTRPRIHGVMLGLLFRAVWLVVYGVARTPPLLGTALFFVFFTNALVDASFASLLQLKVPPEMQGRIFALLYQMMYIANPLALALTGPLVDRVLEPAVGGPGWAWVAPVVGSREGSGMGLLIACAGAIIFVLTAGIYAWPKTRSLEADLPDYTT
jgi:MFS family permease